MSGSDHRLPEFSGVFDHDRSGQSIAIQGMTLVGGSTGERREEIIAEVSRRLCDAGVALNVIDVVELQAAISARLTSHEQGLL